MGGRGNSASRNTEPSVEEKFTYKQSPDLKSWTDAEEKRTKNISDYVNKMLFAGDGEFQEFYEENYLEEVESFELSGHGVYKDETITVDKMNFVYAQNWDENDRHVKQGKAVTGSIYYTVNDSNGAVDENHQAYKTKADAIHAAKLYIDEQKQVIEYWKRKKK